MDVCYGAILWTGSSPKPRKSVSGTHFLCDLCALRASALKMFCHNRSVTTSAISSSCSTMGLVFMLLPRLLATMRGISPGVTP